MIGKTISHYQILEKLGAGGMGDIYKAQDTRLNRFVAVKVLSLANASDPERRRRFAQEAQAASALNHPNIITIYDIIEDGDTEFMVMEFVDGSTLAEAIPEDGLEMAKALALSVQMAAALQAAHAAGIVHRDLKPGNVMVTSSGLVKILDFGLAKLTDPDPVTAVGDETMPISSPPMTVEGTILGTVSYMSPEQAEGKRVDPRSDIFSFGLVLYEMVTGCKAFAGNSTVSTLTMILRDEAKPIGEIVANVPPALEEIVNRALRKHPEQRWQTMGDMHAALVALKQRFDSIVLYGAPPVTTRKKSHMVAVVAALGILVAGAAALRWWVTHQKTPPPPIVVRTVPPPAPVLTPPVTAPSDTTAAAGEPANRIDAPLTNQGVLDMVQAKVAPAVIIGQIRSSKTNFDLSTAEIIRLTKLGVPDTVLEAMRNPKGAPRPRPALPTVQPAPPVATPQPSAPSLMPVPQPVESAAPALPPTQPIPSTAPTQTVTIFSGQAVTIALVDDVAPDPTPGQPLRFRVTKDFSVGETVVIAKGAAATGEIVEGGKKKLIGGVKPTFRLMQVETVAGTKLSVRATPGRKAGAKIDRAIEPPGWKSKDLLAPAGSQYIAYIDGDQTVTVKR